VVLSVVIALLNAFYVELFTLIYNTYSHFNVVIKCFFKHFGSTYTVHQVKLEALDRGGWECRLEETTTYHTVTEQAFIDP